MKRIENYPKFDERNYEVLFEEFKNLAKSYTPEWNFNEYSSDFGVTLAQIFCNILENNIDLLNINLSNYYVAFLNIIGVYPSPSKPAYGFVKINTVANTGNAYIKKGKKMVAFDEKDQEIVFETEEDLFAINAALKNIFFVDALFNDGTIAKVLNKDKNIVPFKVFNFDNLENLNKRWIYFDDPIIFNTNETECDFYFYNKFSSSQEKNFLDLFSSPKALWQYYDGLIWRNITNARATSYGGIKIAFSGKIEILNLMNKTSRFIRCKPGTSEEIKLTSICYHPCEKILAPDKLYSENEEIENNNCSPFGERLAMHKCFYIKSDEAFSKIGSKIEIKVEVKFIKFESEIKETIKNYRFMMSDLDFAETMPSNSSIEEIVWEYWNGRGWTRILCKSLIDDGNFSENMKNIDSGKIFKPFDETKKIIISFHCPENIKSITVNSEVGYFIRARISKINNSYDSMSTHIIPIVNTISIKYFYEESIKFKNIFIEYGTENRIVNFNDENILTSLIKKIEDEHPAIYFCFDEPLTEDIVRIFFDIEDGFGEIENLAFKWEYFTKTPEKNDEWCVINVVDLTKGFCHSESVSLFGCKNMEKTILFGMEGFFIRIINIDDKLRNLPDKSKPLIKDIKINVAKVVQKSTYEPQYFSIQYGEENKHILLPDKNLFEVNVWVNEFGKLSTSENEKFIAGDGIISKIERDKFDNIEKIWVKWHKIDNILNSGPKDRVYEVDFINSQIIFGDNKNGKIPPEQDDDSIKVEYSSCEGARGNIDEYKINDFSSVVPHVSNVVNFKSFIGGTDPESIEQAAKKMFSKICGAGKIISFSDFENSILSNDSSIDKIRCEAHINKYGEKSIGDFCICVLPKNFPCGYEKFESIKNRILSFLKKNSSVSFFCFSKNIYVFEVFYVETNINLDIIIDDFNFYQHVYKNVEYEIKKFLDPIRGGFSKDGWKIGDIIDENFIRNCIKKVKHIKLVKNLILFFKILAKEGRKDISYEDLKKIKFIIPIFGKLKINLEVLP
ncbi:MAG: baseplate J/gp47 family protein [Candidatus Improbicoccus pseudotrichonymphae]|uniref:Baseplate J/gp47 family protein n=1 Tax=Candidatus Improbicoccus pseudotrichonymphae TaxID=3033792 RepID=A0AA48IAW6_9FIRM|nr:MAG: baseplate J/gp47 family protein [Candidatus Improbicoccus pseudotrichonymphae]